MCIGTDLKLGKRHIIKKAIKGSLSWVKKLPGKAINFAKSLISERSESKLGLSRMFPFICFGLIFQPKTSLAFDFDSVDDFDQNVMVIGGSYKFTRELVASGVKSIPDPGVRSAVS
jgi:hypothetical protein